MRRLYLMKTGTGMMMVGQYRSGGGGVEGEEWIDDNDLNGKRLYFI